MKAEMSQNLAYVVIFRFDPFTGHHNPLTVTLRLTTAYSVRLLNTNHMCYFSTQIFDPARIKTK